MVIYLCLLEASLNIYSLLLGHLNEYWMSTTTFLRPWCTSFPFLEHSLQSQWSRPFTKQCKYSNLYHIHKSNPQNLAQFTPFIHNSHLTPKCQHYKDRGQYASIRAGSLWTNWNKFIYYFMLLIPNIFQKLTF